MTDNSMLEKPRVRQGQRMRGSKLYCLKLRGLASSVVDSRPFLYKERRVSEGATGCISRLHPVGPSTLPVLGKRIRASNGNPTHSHSIRYSNRGLPKPESLGHGNGGPIVVKLVNGQISCEGAQSNDSKDAWRYASADSRKDAWNHRESRGKPV